MFSRIKNDGIRIMYMVSSAMTIVFLIQFIGNTLLNIVFQVPIIIDTVLRDSYTEDETAWLLSMFFTSTALYIVPFLAALFVRNKTKGLVDNEIDVRVLHFAVGFYLTLVNVGDITEIINSVMVLLFNGRWGWGVHINARDIIFVTIRSIVPIVYVILGFMFLRKSGYLLKKEQTDNID